MKRKVMVAALLVLGAVAGAVSFRTQILAWFSEEPRVATSAVQHGTPGSTHGPRKVLYWVDPMHPAYRSDKPGIAPDCGMQLVPVYADEAEKQAALPPGTVKISSERQQLIGVKLGRAEVRALRKTIRAVARLTYDESKVVHYHNKVEGWIEQIFVNYVGAPVHKGDPLFTLYSPELVSAQQEYLIALEAKRQLAGSPVPEIARSTAGLLEAARRRLELWDVTEDQIRRLEDTRQPQRTITFYSPHHGVVLEKKAFEHLRVTPETDLYVFADLSTIWAVADVYEYEAPLVRVGQPATMTLGYLPGRKFMGKVSYIYPQVDPQTRTLRVRLDFPNPQLELRPEMFATAEFEADLGEQVVVPAEAVLESGTRSYVFVARGEGYFEPREVTLGQRSDGYCQILSGLKRGEAVVTSANFLIDSESRLKAAAAQMGGQHGH